MPLRMSFPTKISIVYPIWKCLQWEWEPYPQKESSLGTPADSPASPVGVWQICKAFSLITESFSCWLFHLEVSLKGTLYSAWENLGTPSVCFSRDPSVSFCWVFVSPNMMMSPLLVVSVVLPQSSLLDAMSTESDIWLSCFSLYASDSVLLPSFAMWRINSFIQNPKHSSCSTLGWVDKKLEGKSPGGLQYHSHVLQWDRGQLCLQWLLLHVWFQQHWVHWITRFVKHRFCPQETHDMVSIKKQL